MVIGLVGYKQSGKTTVAEYLSREHGFVSLNFKDGLIAEMRSKLYDTLRSIAMDGNDIEDDNLVQTKIDNLFRTKPPVMRSLMQNYGTDVRRNDDKNYWVDKYLASLTKMEAAEPFPIRIVTDDVRFANEAEAVRNNGGILIRVIREDQHITDLHISETEHEKIEEDFTIEAKTGEHDYLFRQLESVIDTLKKNVD